MNNKKILWVLLIVGAPFFAKGVVNAPKNNKTSRKIFSTVKMPDFTDKYNIDPAVVDHGDYFKAKKHFEIKLNIYQEFGYDTPDSNFIINSYQDSSVEYVRQDKSGFIRKSGSRTWRNMNPGAIRTSPFAKKMGAVGDAGGFAVFSSEETGMIALKELLRSNAYASLTIYDAIHKYAPFCDNNDPIRYQRHLYERTGININKTLKELSDAELNIIAENIKVLEGWKQGTEEYFGADADVLHEYINVKQKQYN